MANLQTSKTLKDVYIAYLESIYKDLRLWFIKTG